MLKQHENMFTNKVLYPFKELGPSSPIIIYILKASIELRLIRKDIVVAY
jgi:hypothetical protein